jgi:hypothetical protein
MKKLSIILVDWNGYSLRRNKVLGENSIKCGLGRILDKMNKYHAGMDFELNLIINCKDEDEQNSQWYTLPFLFKNYWSLTNEKYKSLQNKYPFINNVYFRDNTDMDIGAYNHGLDILRSENYQGDVLFMNTSVILPSRDGWLGDYQRLFYREDNTGLCGTTLNHNNNISQPPIFMPHVQSFFLYTNTDILMKVFDNRLPCNSSNTNSVFISDGSTYSEKDRIIVNGEIGISQRVLNQGYSIRCSSFPDFNYKNGDDWLIPVYDIRYKRKYLQFANQA